MPDGDRLKRWDAEQSAAIIGRGIGAEGVLVVVVGHDGYRVASWGSDADRAEVMAGLGREVERLIFGKREGE